jgi:hypothetical protein
MEAWGMQRLMKSVLLAAVILLAGCLATACAQSARGAVTASSPSAGAPATPTAPPSPTVASPTAAPTTASPTAAPSTASTTPSPTPSSTSTSTGGFGGNLIWLWFVLGALVLLGIILLATRSPARARRPSAGAANWRSRAVDVYAKGAAFDGAVRAAERQGVFAEAAGARWADLQRRADDLSEALYAMRETAPTEHRRVQVENAILSLRAVRDAMDAERFPGETRSQQAGILSSRLSALESSLNALRVPDDPLL